MPMLPEDFIQRVTEATDIADVIGEYVQLKKSGGEFVGLCPFHNEKSASFSVNSDKGVFMCRGCGEAGNAIQFLMKTQGASFQDSVLSMARKAGIAAPAFTPHGQDRDAGRYTRLQEVLDEAKDLYKAGLYASTDDARQALAYVRERGVTDEMIERFEIGYAPRGGGLRHKMPNATQKELVDAGLIYKSEYHNGEMMEWMNNRIVFPIFSASGKAIAFGGRSMQVSAKAKYLNTPETLLFKKGSELFGQHQAANAIRREGFSIVTEGYLDVVVPSGVGVANTVASMGTAFSEESLKKLFRMGDTVVFCFDGDAPGRAAALRAMRTAAGVVDEKKSCKFAFLPDGMDPDDYVRKNGAEGYKELIAKADPMSRFMVKHFSATNDIAFAEGKASFGRDCMDVIERIHSLTLKALMVEEVRTVIGPNIPLPGVTPGIEAVVPMQSVAPKRSALRVFREAAAPMATPAQNAQKAQPDSAAKTFSVPVAEPLPANKPKGFFASLSEENGPQAGRVAAAETSQQVEQVGKARQVRQEAKVSLAPAPPTAAPIRFRARQASAPETMVEASRDAQTQPIPSQAMRLLAFVLREPALAAADIEADQFAGQPHEIAALAATSFAAAPRGGEPGMQSAALIAQLSAGPHAGAVASAMRLPEFLAKDMDAVAEATAIVWRAAKRVERTVQAKRMRIGRPG